MEPGTGKWCLKLLFTSCKCWVRMLYIVSESFPSIILRKLLCAGNDTYIQVERRFDHKSNFLIVALIIKLKIMSIKCHIVHFVVQSHLWHSLHSIFFYRTGWVFFGNYNTITSITVIKKENISNCILWQLKTTDKFHKSELTDNSDIRTLAGQFFICTI